MLGSVIRLIQQDAPVQDAPVERGVVQRCLLSQGGSCRQVAAPVPSWTRCTSKRCCAFCCCRALPSRIVCALPDPTSDGCGLSKRAMHTARHCVLLFSITPSENARPDGISVRAGMPLGALLRRRRTRCWRCNVQISATLPELAESRAIDLPWKVGRPNVIDKRRSSGFTHKSQSLCL